MAQWILPSDEALDELLALRLVQRGEALARMTAHERSAYAMVYSRRDGRDPYRIKDLFDTWMELYLDSLQRCGAHQRPVVAFIGGAGLCELCAAERYGREGRHTPPATQQLSRPDPSVAAPTD